MPRPAICRYRDGDDGWQRFYVSEASGFAQRSRPSPRPSTWKLLLARKSGEYLGDVEQGHQRCQGAEILKATSEGPIFMANLPAGSYEVAATTEGLT